MRLRYLALLIVPALAIGAFFTPSPRITAESIDPLERAERLYAEGSYRLALERYAAIDAASLPPEKARWLAFRLADCSWRSLASTDTADRSGIEEARRRLEELLREAVRLEQRDRIWAEVQESMGDLAWSRPDGRNWSQAWPRYKDALDWWAGSGEIDLARGRYLAIVRKIAVPPAARPYYSYGYHGNRLPLEIVQNALEIARDPGDLAHFSYLLAMTLRHGATDRATHGRIREAFENAMEAGRSTAWYDDALFQYAEWLNGQGTLVRTEEGGYRTEPDHVGALELYRQLTTEFEQGETRHYRTAQIRINTITRPSVGVSVAGAFLPGAEIEYHLSWRNVERFHLALFRVNLTRDVQFTPERSGGQWLATIGWEDAERIRLWNYTTDDRGLHLAGGATETLEGELEPGAYLLMKVGGGPPSHALILVTEAALTLKPSPNRALVYVCDALDGSPRPGADVTIWHRLRRGSKQPWTRTELRADQNGLVSLDLPDRADREFFVAADAAGHQAFATAGSWRSRHPGEIWKVYAFSDRPAYRPGEEMNWKLVARIHDGDAYSTPSGRELQYTIRDPLGNEIDKGEVRLNAFGSAWGSFELKGELRLGEYSLTLNDPTRDRVLGVANLFRLEEYKLPEFRVEVGTATEKAYRAGERVEAEVRAEYYFGGPVAGAKVEAVVYRRPVHIFWRPPREFPWFHQDYRHGRRYRGGPGEIVHRQEVQTDATGRATISFETGRFPQSDMEFTIEARVTDASRREITGTGTVRVGTRPYYLFPSVDHYLYRPGDRVTASFRAIDVNENPVQAEGRVRITRDVWREIWVDPYGRKVEGVDLEEAKEACEIFPPPPPRPGGPSWRLDFEGYKREELFSRIVATGADGQATVEFTPQAPGYYGIEWTGTGDDLPEVRAETAFWVSDEDHAGPGYRPGGVEIILDRESFRAGERAAVMLTAPVSGSWILFTVEGDGLLEHRLVRLDGNARLLHLEIDERHVPNFFLEAAMVRDADLYLDVKDVVVPPVRHFLQVEVAAGREEYMPGEEGTVTVTTSDHDGRPVPAEVSLGVADESVYAIQEDYAGDPRQFYFGQRRSSRTETTSTFRFRRYRTGEERDKEEEEKQPVARYAESKMDARREKSALASRRMSEPAAAAPTEGFALDEEAAASEVVKVRTDFRSTAFWRPDIVTGEDGTATVTVKFPESLSSWRATARAATRGSQFGIGRSSARTNLPLMARLQAPRFFVAGDTAVVSAVINNNSAGELQVRTEIEAEGIELPDGGSRRITLPAGGETRVDWRVRATKAGTARFRVTARGGDHSDAMEKSYPVHEHGIEKFVARSGKVRGDGAAVVVDIPKERRPGSAALEVRVTPSLAVAMLDALPYLIDYPYGCTEQTMSRFLPTVIAIRTLERLGLEPEDVAARILEGTEEGRKDLQRVDDMVRQGLDRLRDFQHDDGGWGWWKEGDGDLFMSAYVLWGLAVAAEAGVDVDRGMVERAAGFLNRTIVEAEEQPDLQAWILHALTSARRLTGEVSGSRFQRTAYENLWNRRDRLNAYSRALLALSAVHLGDRERAVVLVRNLSNGVIRDRAPDRSAIGGAGGTSGAPVIGTAHWGTDGIAWRWSEGGVESTAFVLRALLAVDPEHELVEPVMNWLAKNRRGARWSNTRDTAIVVLALTDYLRISGELASEVEYAVTVNGREVGTGRVTPETMLSAAGRFAVDRSRIRDGANEVRIVRRSGEGPLYYSVEAAYFSLEEPVTPAGNEIFVRRDYFRKAPYPTLLKGVRYEPVRMEDGGGLASGERVEVVLTIEAKNDYEYLVFEDLKPAGLEAVRLRSGEPARVRQLTAPAAERDAAVREPDDYTGRSRYVYQELRDRKVAMFIGKLPEGLWELRYELRAEIPGSFHALPVLGHAMYVPEIRCNGAEIRMTVEEAAD